jgi:hypothetical protein
MNIDGKACNNVPEAVNKLALSARLGHSCETEWNKHDSSHYSKQNSKVLSQGKILAILSTSLYDKLNYIQQITSEQQRCPDVMFIGGSKKYLSTTV